MPGHPKKNEEPLTSTPPGWGKSAKGKKAMALKEKELMQLSPWRFIWALCHRRGYHAHQYRSLCSRYIFARSRMEYPDPMKELEVKYEALKELVRPLMEHQRHMDEKVHLAPDTSISEFRSTAGHFRKLYAHYPCPNPLSPESSALTSTAPAAPTSSPPSANR